MRFRRDISFFILAVLGSVLSESIESGTVYSVHHTGANLYQGWTVLKGHGGVAQGHVDLTNLVTGWHGLHLKTNSNDASVSDDLRAFGVGYLEGYITRNQIYQAYSAFVSQNLNVFGPTPAPIRDFINNNVMWMNTMIKKHTTLVGAADLATMASDADFVYWRQVDLVMKQLNGTLQAYNANSPAAERISDLHWFVYLLQSELGDYLAKFNISANDVQKRWKSHCSVLIKLSPDSTNLYSSHVTWSSYFQMLRIYKHYQLSFSEPTSRSIEVSLSGYPGYPMSIDDFYVVNRHLMVTETTNSVYNNSLYVATTPQTVPYWIRCLVANRIALDGETWTQSFAQYNSGTYNNQWIIVDYNKFSSKKPIQAGLLWIIETLPGYTTSKDMTSYLVKKTYWKSYNVPYFPTIFSLSGNEAMAAKFGDPFTWCCCPRAKIFDKLAPAVTNITGMKRIMRYNQWQTDPLSNRSACNAISARCDLTTPWIDEPLSEYSPFGAIDAKITDAGMILHNAAEAVCGPTWDAQPPFAWTQQWSGIPTLGMPKVFDFDFVYMAPSHR